MKQMFETRDVPATTVFHVDRCLSCLGCMTACPSGVDYMHLVDLARVRIEQRGHRSPNNKHDALFLSRVLPYPSRFKAMLILGWFARPFREMIGKLGMKRIAAALELVAERRAEAQNLAPPIRLQSAGAAAQTGRHYAGLRAGGAGALRSTGLPSACCAVTASM